MSSESRQPHPSDAVLGGQSPPPLNAAVLGGLAGVKLRLASESLDVRMAALQDTLNYGKEGLCILAHIVETESGSLQWTACDLLWNKVSEKERQILLKYLPIQQFKTIIFEAYHGKVFKIEGTVICRNEDLGKKVILEMTEICGGTFLMGKSKKQRSFFYEMPQHKVKIKAFCMSKFPITQAQWRAVAALPEINIYLPPNPSYFKGDNLPVETINWHEAVEFCARLSQKTGRTYHLPSEAQWEYACRGGMTNPFSLDGTIISDLHNADGESSGDRQLNQISGPKTRPVGSLPPNAFGLYDMHENVREWCADFWHENYWGAPSDGSVWESEGNPNSRVLRGVAWLNAPSDCINYSTIRNYFNSSARSSSIGFRVAVSSAPTL